MNVITKRLLTAMTALIFTISLGAINSIPSSAQGATITLSPSTVAVSTATTVTLSLTTTAAVPVGGTIQVARPTSGYTGTGSLAVSAGAIGATTNTTSGTDTLHTATVSTQIPAGALTITVSGLTSAATAGNYSFRVFTSAGNYGGAFQYVGQANVVTVRARVTASLAFVIRNSADTADSNTCDMGDLTVSTVGTCSYRLKVTTNARSGYSVNVQTSGNFSNGSDTFANAAAGTGGTGGTNITAGTETYGALITPGSITGSGGSVSLASAYNAGATNDVSYVNTSSATLLTANKPNNPATTDTTNTTLVRHDAATSGSTPAGLYTQTVTYTVSPSF